MLEHALVLARSSIIWYRNDPPRLDREPSDPRLPNGIFRHDEQLVRRIPIESDEFADTFDRVQPLRRSPTDRQSYDVPCLECDDAVASRRENRRAISPCSCQSSGSLTTQF